MSKLKYVLIDESRVTLNTKVFRIITIRKIYLIENHMVKSEDLINPVTFSEHQEMYEKEVLTKQN